MHIMAKKTVKTDIVNYQEILYYTTSQYTHTYIPI